MDRTTEARWLQPTASPRLEAATERSYPTPKVRGGGQGEQPHIQGAAAARGQESRDELLHIQGQEGWL